MKREVDSTLVEKGVTERVRLTQTYEKRREELQRQHDSVKGTLQEYKTKVNRKNFTQNALTNSYLYFFFPRPKQYSIKKQILVPAYYQKHVYQTSFYHLHL